MTTELTTTTPANALVSSFLASLNPNTVRAYSKALDHFTRFCGKSSVGEASHCLFNCTGGEANGIALAYQTSLKQLDLSPATINLRVNALRSLVKMARVLGLITWKLEIKNVATKSYRDTRGCGEEGYRKVLAHVNGSDAVSTRNRAILRLCWRGLRRSEIGGLKLSDFDALEQKVSIMGKARTEKEWLTIGPDTVKAIKEWIVFRGEEPGALFTSLDPGHNKARLADTGIYRIVTKLGVVTGVKRMRPHGIRHASITAALDNGMGLREVARFARHSRLDTTVQYDDNRMDLAGDVARRIE